MSADNLRMIDAQPELAAQMRRVKGGYLKIQGTWLPFEVSSTRFRRNHLLGRPLIYDSLLGDTSPRTPVSR